MHGGGATRAQAGGGARLTSAHVDDLCAFSSSVQLTQETLADEDKPVQTKLTGTIIISTKGNLESHLVNGLLVIGFVKTHA